MTSAGQSRPVQPVRLRGSALARRLLALAGWRVVFDGLPARQGLLVVYPHTSNWDFVVLVFAKWTVGIPARFWAKDSLFRIPVLGPWLRWLGGVAVDRSSPRGVVAEEIAQMRAAVARDDFFWLAVAPEGTRGRTEGWRSGFYQVAVGTGVPVGLARLDFGRREVVFTHFLRLQGDPDADFARMAEAFEGVRGRRPELASPIRLRPSQNLASRKNEHE